MQNYSVGKTASPGWCLRREGGTASKLCVLVSVVFYPAFPVCEKSTREGAGNPSSDRRRAGRGKTTTYEGGGNIDMIGTERGRDRGRHREKEGPHHENGGRRGEETA